MLHYRRGTLILFCVVGLLAFGALFRLNSAVGGQGDFEDLGIPVKTAAVMSAVVGPDRSGQGEKIYLSCAQTASNLLLLAVDPDTGDTQSYLSPTGPGAWAIARGADEKIYLGTWNGGHLLRFDPQKPELGIRDLGRAIASESYIWMLATGPNGKLYGCTFPNAKLFSFDPTTEAIEDLGRLDDDQQYARSLAIDEKGRVFVGIGFGQANVVVFDPQTKTKRSIFPAAHKSAKIAAVQKMQDGRIYVQAGTQWFRVEDEAMVAIATAQVPGQMPLKLRGGRVIKTGRLPMAAKSLEILDTAKRATRKIELNYAGQGALIFVLAPGLSGNVYGSSVIPLQLFHYDIATKSTQVLGNPTPVDGQLYSLLAFKDRLYLAAYAGGGYLSVYHPDKPFQFGTDANSNPRGLGEIGEGHMRPRAMILGPNQKIFIGSLPPYGTWGGAMAVFDPQSNKVVANHPQIVPNQGVASLAFEPRSGLIFGGSDIAGGGGTTPKARDAVLFAWDDKQKEKVVSLVPVAGDRAIVALAVARSKVFAVSVPSNTLSVYDPHARRIVHQARIILGRVPDISLQLHSNGKIYGLAGNSVFTIDPQTFKITPEASWKGKITAGFALTPQWLYFADEARLIRYRIGSAR